MKLKGSDLLCLRSFCRESAGARSVTDGRLPPQTQHVFVFMQLHVFQLQPLCRFIYRRLTAVKGHLVRGSASELHLSPGPYGVILFFNGVS